MVPFSGLFLLVLVLAITIIVPARWFGMFVAVLVGIVVYLWVTRPTVELDHSSPFSGIDDGLIPLLAMVLAAVVVCKAVFILQTRAKRRLSPVPWIILSSIVFISLFEEPDENWATIAGVLLVPAVALIVLRAVIVGLYHPSTRVETKGMRS